MAIFTFVFFKKDGVMVEVESGGREGKRERDEDRRREMEGERERGGRRERERKGEGENGRGVLEGRGGE